MSLKFYNHNTVKHVYGGHPILCAPCNSGNFSEELAESRSDSHRKTLYTGHFQNERLL